MLLKYKSVIKVLIPGLLTALPAVSFCQTDTLVKPATTISKNIIQITGIIKDAATQLPIPGANIAVNAIAATISDENGNFKINIPSKEYALLVSAAGYTTKEVALRGLNTVSVALFEDGYTSAYDRVLMPFGEQFKNSVPYSVVSVDTKGAWGRVNETTDSYLQGKVSGLESVRKSGSPEIGANMYIRGYNSLYAGSQPLVIVDGVIYDTKSYGASLISGYENNPLSYIDIKDIDNITVIKDAASIYGTRGSNGVILITTAKAKDVATRLNFGAFGGYNIAGDNLPVLGADDYRFYLSDILKTKGLTQQEINNLPYMSNQVTPEYYNFHQQTNWQDVVSDNASSQNYYLKVTGGDDIATYALSLGYLSNEGTIARNKLNRYQTRFNADLNLTKKLKGQVNLSFSRNERNINHQGLDSRLSPLFTALVKAPFLAPSIINESNVASPNLSDTDVFGISNPAAQISNSMINKVNGYRFVAGVGLNYIFNKEFELSSRFGLTFDKNRENLFVPQIGIAPVKLDTEIGYNQTLASVQRLFSIYNDTYLTYRKDFTGNHKIITNLGFRYNSNKTEYDTGLSYNTASDDFVTLNAGQGSLRVVGGSLGKWNWLNTYANINYSAKDKYFFSFNVAADASSRFGAEIKDALTINKVKYAVLPSLSAAWLISSEDFLANNNFIESLKLRASYGLVGNDDLGNYTSRSYYSSQNFLGRQGLLRGNIANPEIKWETNTKFNLGVDASVLSERLSFSLDFYHHRINDLIVYEPLLAPTGFDFIITNTGAMKNMGAEAAVNGRLLNRKDVKWDLGFTLSKNRNEVTKLPSGEDILTDFAWATILTRVGETSNLFYGYKTNGIYTSDLEAANSGISNTITDNNFPVRGGDVKFVDTNNDNIIDEKDRQVIGDPNPDFVGSVFNNVSYKRWTLNTLFTFSLGNDIYNGIRANIESMSNYNNQSVNALNRWHVDGQQTNMPRAEWGDPMQNSRFSDRWIEDGSYLRLRTIALNYDIPLKIAVIRNASVYAMANNLFTLTDYLGFDPEFSAGTSMFSRGTDIGLNPQYKSVQIGLRIGL